MTTIDPDAVAAALAALDAEAEDWAQRIGWRAQLDQLAEMSATFAGRRIDGSGGPELCMLILRQRNLIDRWVRQAYTEGFLAGGAAASSPPGAESPATATTSKKTPA